MRVLQNLKLHSQTGMRSFQRPVDPVHQNISPSYPPAAALHFLSAALRIHPPTVTIPVYILLPRDRTFFFFAAGMKSTGIDSGWEEEIPWVKIAATFLGLIAVMVVTVTAQNRIVNFTKEINPEKKGSVYDLKFQKTWIASCDEAEQLQIYRAAFRAYTAMNYAALGMFLVCFIGMLSWNFGLLPLTMVLFVWLTGVIVYGVESLRMTGGR